MEQAYRLGFTGVFLFDHLWPLGGDRHRPSLECWTLLAALAAHSARLAGPGPAPLRLGTLVTRAGLRPPALVARMAVSAGQMAGAPLVVGVGSGDALNRDENRAFGLPYPDLEGRSAAVEACVRALRDPAGGGPAPTVWVGGAGARMRALAGRVADAWNAWQATPEELAAGLADVRRSAAAAGRDPGTVAGTWGGQVLVGEDAAQASARLADWGASLPPEARRPVLAGGPDAVVARLAELGEAGASWCVLAFVGGEILRARVRLAESARLIFRNL